MNQRGSASVVMLGVVGLLLLLAVAVADVGMLLGARLQAAAAADAAALAAAPVTFAPFGATAGPREEAARFASANGSTLVSCHCPVDRTWNTRQVEVTVERSVRLLMMGNRTVAASSRAEFVPVALLE